MKNESILNEPYEPKKADEFYVNDPHAEDVHPFRKRQEHHRLIKIQDTGSGYIYLNPTHISKIRKGPTYKDCAYTYITIIGSQHPVESKTSVEQVVALIEETLK